jgi:hypothetical protein
MDDLRNYHTWQHTLALLSLIASPFPSFNHEMNPSPNRRSAFRDNRSSRVVPQSPASAFIEIIERCSPTSIVVCWCDATSGRYGDQLWTLGVAAHQAICALSGAQVRLGEAIYRPRLRRNGRNPSNAGQLILASVVSTNDQSSAAPVAHPCSGEEVQ